MYNDENLTNHRSPFAICQSFIAALVVVFSTQATLAQDRPAQFVDATAIVPGLIVDMRYAGAHNFVGRSIDGYEAPRCLLTQTAAAALAEVARDLAPRGLLLKVFDCYRPTRAVADFVRWAHDLNDLTGKTEFYPTVDKRILFRDGYIAERSNHSRGSTVDLTLAQTSGRELDMGTPFDFFSPRSWTAAESIPASARANRALLAASMRRHGFRPYEKEWWHFTKSHEPFPNTYFDFPIR
jgi:D-alanyl-D-alanine dipeptidase